MDENEMSEWEREAMQRAERRFPLSEPDEEHEFSGLPGLGLRKIRGTYFSVHDNRAEHGTGAPERYRGCLLLVHSEKNRFRFLCDLLMTTWLPELPDFVRLLKELEPPTPRKGVDPHPVEDAISEESLWQAESFGIAVHSDCYRIGYMSGPAPLFASKDLLLGILELVAEGLTTVGENLEYSPRALLEEIRSLRARITPASDPDLPDVP